jgi:magnesium chelatase subunit I
MSIANYENMLSNAERRAVLHGEQRAVARIGDLAYIAASARGKMELAMTEETGEEDHLVTRLVDEAVKTVFDEHFDTKQFRDVVAQFESGKSLEIGDSASTAEYLQQIESCRPLAKHAERIAGELEPSLNTGPTAGPLRVAVAEFLLDGLHANNRLNKRTKAGKTAYGF